MKKGPAQPWMPAPYDPDGSVTGAIKALANDPKHKNALSWIINTLCATYDLSYRPGADGDRDTAFAEGKRHVGLQLVKHINMPMPTRPVK